MSDVAVIPTMVLFLFGTGQAHMAVGHFDEPRQPLSGRVGAGRGRARRPVHHRTRVYPLSVQTLPISTVKDQLDELVNAVSATSKQVAITRNGSTAAVLIGVNEWESIQETLFWLSQPGIRDSLVEADADIAAGRVFDEDTIRAGFDERTAVNERGPGCLGRLDSRIGSEADSPSPPRARRDSDQRGSSPSSAKSQ